jgi:hypothetical protein
MRVSSMCYSPLTTSSVAPEALGISLNYTPTQWARSRRPKKICQDGLSKAADCLASNLSGHHVGFGSAYSSLVVGRASMGQA